MFERLKSEIGNRPKDKVNAEVIEIADKVVKPVKATRELEDKPQTTIECCVHCGSVAIKKHGKTKAGVQRYICKDCGKSFSENYGLITHYSHLSDWQWQELIRGTVDELSLTDIAKNIGVSVSTAWSCRMKIYQTLKSVYGYCDTFNSIVEADGKYERVSFKGKKDKKFFIEKLGRLPRHHRSKSERHEYLDKAGKYEELFKDNPRLLKEMIFGSQKRMLGRATIDTNHQHVCILTAIDRNNNIYIEPITAGTAKSQDVYDKLHGRIATNAVLVTDGHHSYKYFIRKDRLEHKKVIGGTYVSEAYNLATVNSLHRSMSNYIKRCKPATKYLDLYCMKFWWMQKNKDISNLKLVEKLYNIITGCVSYEARARMTRVTIKSLVSRELPIDTKGFYPKCA